MCCEGDFQARFNNSATCTPGQKKQLADCLLAKSQPITLFETLKCSSPSPENVGIICRRAGGSRHSCSIVARPYLHFLLGDLCKFDNSFCFAFVCLFFVFFWKEENKRSTPVLSGLPSSPPTLYSNSSTRCQMRRVTAVSFKHS